MNNNKAQFTNLLLFCYFSTKNGKKILTFFLNIKKKTLFYICIARKNNSSKSVSNTFQEYPYKLSLKIIAQRDSLSKSLQERCRVPFQDDSSSQVQIPSETGYFEAENTDSQ